MSIAELVQSEEQKRRRQWDASERWRVILQTISWAERQTTVQRNTPDACLREQRRKLAQHGSGKNMTGKT